MYNQELFKTFDTLRDYYDHSFHIQRVKWLLPLKKISIFFMYIMTMISLTSLQVIFLANQ